MPPKLPVLKPKQVIAALLRAGLYVHHQKGSHARLLHVTRPDVRVTVPKHNKDVPPPFLRHRILKQAGLTEEEFCGFSDRAGAIQQFSPNVLPTDELHGPTIDVLKQDFILRRVFNPSGAGSKPAAA